MTKKICISGYYGFDNFGDETILKILVENLKNFSIPPKITVFSSNPEKTSENLDVNSVDSFNLLEVLLEIVESDILISGGGSLLQDVTSKKSLIYYLGIIFLAKLFRKRIVIFAQGIGPIHNKLLRLFTKLLLKGSDYISVRDSKSINLLYDWKINADLCSDPVWNLKIEGNQKTDKIGIQLRDCEAIDEYFLTELAENINKYYADKEIVILSLQNTLDLKISNVFNDILQDINPQINSKVIENKSNEDVIKDIASLNTLIAMRYHACLIAIKSKVKLLPINYDIKVESLANLFNLQYLNFKNEKENNRIFKEFYNNQIEYSEDKIKAQFFDFDEIEKIYKK